MIYPRQQINNADDNIVIYVESLDADDTIIKPIFGKIEDISGYHAEATIFVDCSGFRNMFKVYGVHHDELSYRTNINENVFNVTNPLNSSTPFVDLNPAKANVIEYIDMPSEYNIKFNGKNTLALNADILQTDDNDLIATNSSYFKVCHDYVRHCADQIGATPSDSRIFTNRNAMIADILSKGQMSVVYDFLESMRKPSKDAYDNTKQILGKDLLGYDLTNDMYLQIQYMNYKRLALQKNSSGQFITSKSDPDYNPSQIYYTNLWQEVPLIAGDVICFKYTFNEIQNVSKLDGTIGNISARTYLIKLCLINEEDYTQGLRNLPTKVIDFDALQIADDDTPADDDETLAFYETISNTPNSSTYTVKTNTEKDILNTLNNSATILQHYRAKQNLGTIPTNSSSAFVYTITQISNIASLTISPITGGENQSFTVTVNDAQNVTIGEFARIIPFHDFKLYDNGIVEHNIPKTYANGAVTLSTTETNNYIEFTLNTTNANIGSFWVKIFDTNAGVVRLIHFIFPDPLPVIENTQESNFLTTVDTFNLDDKTNNNIRELDEFVVGESIQNGNVKIQEGITLNDEFNTNGMVYLYAFDIPDDPLVTLIYSNKQKIGEMTITNGVMEISSFDVQNPVYAVNKAYIFMLN